jgi:hypothetical protein
MDINRFLKISVKLQEIQKEYFFEELLEKSTYDFNRKVYTYPHKDWGEALFDFEIEPLNHESIYIIYSKDRIVSREKEGDKYKFKTKDGKSYLIKNIKPKA